MGWGGSTARTTASTRNDELTLPSQIGSRTSSRRQRKEEQAKKKKCTTTRLFTICVCCCCFSVISFLAAVYTVYRMDDDPVRPAATCGDCHCILDGTTPTCPDEAPPTLYPEQMLEAFASQRALNPFNKLDCDAFDDNDCALEPRQTDLGENSVCGIHYEDRNCREYKLKTYQDRDTAEAEGAFITHFGNCGICSTTQDLAVYLKHVDLTTLGEGCGAKAMTNFFQGRDCFKSLGFTESCARLWTDNARKTGWNCGFKCLTRDLLDSDFNGPPPTCPLNNCLKCDENESGPKFKKFAGRTRRTSGLLSAIARPCSEIADIRHMTVCPNTTALVE